MLELIHTSSIHHKTTSFTARDTSVDNHKHDVGHLMNYVTINNALNVTKEVTISIYRTLLMLLACIQGTCVKSNSIMPLNFEWPIAKITHIREN